MNCILFLGFLAVSGSTPLGWDTGSWYGTDIASSSTEEASLRIGLQIQKALERNAVENRMSGIPISVENKGRQSVAAQHVAQEIVQEALRAKQGQTAGGIEEIKQQLQQQSGVFDAGLQSVAQQVKQISTVDAINKLQQHLRMQQFFAPLIQTGSSLAKTLEAVIQAQMVSDSVDIQQFGLSGQTSQTPGQTLQVFRAKIQQLIDESNIQEIQAEIAIQQVKVQQLQQQQQLINQQRQQIQAQKLVLQQSNQGSALVIQLQQTQQVLHLQEQQLVKQQLARQLIIQLLQQALIEQQKQLQQDIVSEQVGQSWPEIQHPWSQGLQEIDGAQWPQYRYPRRYGNTWNLLRNPWDQFGRSCYKSDFSNTQPKYVLFNDEKSWCQGVWSTKLDLIQ